MEKIKAGKKDNSRRKFRGKGPRPDLNKFKREEAAERLKVWSQLSPRDQLAELDRRLGKGVGAAKQRARLTARMDRSRQQPQKAEAPQSAKPVGQLLERGGERVKAKERHAAEQAKRPSK